MTTAAKATSVYASTVLSGRLTLNTLTFFLSFFVFVIFYVSSFTRSLDLVFCFDLTCMFMDRLH